MKYLNNLWLTLLLAGIAVLVFSVGIRVFESTTGVNSTEFSARINAIPTTPLVTENLENHFSGSGEI